MPPPHVLPYSDVPRVSLFVETGTAWGRRIISGVLEHSKKYGPWTIHLQPTGPAETFKFPHRWQAEGIIARVTTQEMADTLIQTGVPVINVSSIPCHAPFTRVLTDLAATTRLAANLFWSRGFRHFAFIGNPALPYVQELFQHYQGTLAERGQKPLHCRADAPIEHHAAWLKDLPKPLAVLCWGPSIGSQIINACRLAALAVPHDVAVLGNDYDELLSEATYPAQSGIRIAAEQIGMKSAALLAARMQGAPPPDTPVYRIDPLGVIEKLSTDTMAVSDPRLASVMTYIHQHATEHITVEDVLHANPMARRTLERNFHKHFHCTIIEQIQQIRVNQARLLLATTDQPVTDIADQCGFASYNYMGRLFHHITGQTPSQYRKQSRPQKH